MSSAPAAGAAAAAPAAGVRPPAGQAAGGVATPRHGRSLFLSPWLVGFSVFFAYPLVMERLPLVHELRPARARLAGSGSDNYRYLFGTDEQIWPAVRQHALADRGARAAAGAVRVRRGADADAREGGARLLPHRLLPARRSCRRSPRRSASSTCSTRPRARSTRSCGKLGIEGPLWFNDPDWSKPSLTLLGLWGVGNVDDHLPRRDPRRAAAPATSRRSSTAPGRCSGCAGSRCPRSAR